MSQANLPVRPSNRAPTQANQAGHGHVALMVIKKIQVFNREGWPKGIEDQLGPVHQIDHKDELAVLTQVNLGASTTDPVLCSKPIQPVLEHAWKMLCLYHQSSH